MEGFAIKNRGISAELYREIINLARNVPAYKAMNISLKYIGPERAGMEMTVIPEFTNTVGIAHGGLIASFADTVMGFAGRSLNLRCVTMEMNINYLVPVQIGETLTGEGSVIHAGKNTIVAEAKIYNSKNKLVAQSRGTFMILGPILKNDN